MKRFFRSLAIVVFALLSFVVCVACRAETVSAAAYSPYDDIIKIHSYDADITVQTDRKVVVKEKIEVEFMATGLSMFYRSLPKETTRYSDISAKCSGNNEFRFQVADNPDLEDFLDINCIGGADKGEKWVYEIAFTMETSSFQGDQMIVDVIPYGFTVPLNDVTVAVHFPTAITESAYKVYAGFESNEVNPERIERSLSDDNKTLFLSAKILPVQYVARYGEYCAEGITLDFTLPKGVLDGYLSTRVFTDNFLGILIGGLAVVGLAVLASVFLRKKTEIITVVNIKAPDEVDPMQAGVTLDGTVDNEDVTSMLYYFAHKGYMSIDFTDEDDPILTAKVASLPNSESAHAKTLFEGLFENAEVAVTDDPFDDSYSASVRVSSLENEFYSSVDAAKLQVKKPKIYEKKSVFGFLAGGLLGVAYAFFAMLFIGLFGVGGSYLYPFGFVLGVPIAGILVLAWVNENYRYKWKRGKRLAIAIAQYAIAGLGVLLFTLIAGSYITTEYERLFIAAFAFACAFITRSTLSRREDYCKTLGDLLGFKDFIVVTEEEKIKFMLEENPELYYKVLPYAQVLGVTDEWEKKFKNILIQPPQWYSGTDLTLFDYIILNRCMTRAMIRATARPQKSGGSFTGMSGGGGSFGGFGGGGFGGGGGGAR